MSLTWDQLSTRLEEAAEEKGIALSAVFEITARCNLSCVMCYIRKPAGDEAAKASELPISWWLKLGEAARDQGLLHVLITGGEPLLRSDFPELYVGLVQMGLLVNINTNGTLITPKIADLFKQYPPNLVSVTVYGATLDSCKAVTGSEDSMARSMKGLGLLLDRGIKTELKTTWVKGNERDYQMLYKYAKSKKINFGIVNYISPSREVNDSDPLGCRIEPEALVDLEIAAVDYILEKMLSETDTPDTKCDLFESDELDRELVNPSQSAFSCNAGLTSLWVTWNGVMLPCGEASEPRVPIMDLPFDIAWGKLKEATRLVPSCESCISCEYKEFCLTCPARLYNETGSFEKRAEYLCIHAKTMAVRV